MKVIFLDIDGVLNSEVSFMDNRRKGVRQDFADLPHKMHVNELNRITDATGAELVLSSTWRILHSLPSMHIIFHMCGIKKDLLEFTPRLSNEKRGTEIQVWLDEWNGSEKANRYVQCGILKDMTVKDFVILDDDSDMLHLMDKLVQTDFRHGLTRVHADEVIRRLS